MRDYLSDQVGHTVPTALNPNIPRIIASGDIKEIQKLLQLLLICAVQCSPRREEFIRFIQTMETSVQVIYLSLLIFIVTTLLIVIIHIDGNCGCYSRNY